MYQLRRSYPTSFLAIFDPSASEQPAFRLQCFDAGVNMVAHDVETLRQTLTEVVIPGGTNGGHLSCPYCNLGNLTEHDMWQHCPTYHINFPDEYPMDNICPICHKQVSQPLQVRIIVIISIIIVEIFSRRITQNDNYHNHNNNKIVGTYT